MFCDRSGDRVQVQAGRKQQQHFSFPTTPVTGPPGPATLVCRSLLLRGEGCFAFPANDAPLNSVQGCGIGSRAKRPELSESARFIPYQIFLPTHPLSQSRGSHATAAGPGRKATPPRRNPFRRADHGALQSAGPGSRASRSAR